MRKPWFDHEGAGSVCTPGAEGVGDRGFLHPGGGRGSLGGPSLGSKAPPMCIVGPHPRHTSTQGTHGTIKQGPTNVHRWASPKAHLALPQTPAPQTAGTQGTPSTELNRPHTPPSLLCVRSSTPPPSER